MGKLWWCQKYWVQTWKPTKFLMGLVFNVDMFWIDLFRTMMIIRLSKANKFVLFMVDMCHLSVNAHEILRFLSPNANYVHFKLHFLNCKAFLNVHPTQSSSFWFLKAHSNFILELSSFCSSIVLWCEFIYCNNFNKACSFVLFNWSTKHFVWTYF